MSSSPDTATNRVQLSAAKRALLEKRLRGEVKGASAEPPIPRRDSAAPPPLSFAQQRLWFLDQFEPGSHAYNIPAAFRLSGPVDADLLERAVQEIVRRHEALRTTFRRQGGEVGQIIAPELKVPVRRIDLRSLPADERERRVAVWLEEEAATPFDLATGPLLRVALLQLGEADFILHRNLHHIVSDGWSSGVFERELMALYNAYARNEPSPLAELPVQYADFAVWQRQWLQGKVLETQLAFWKQRLGGGLPVLELPTDRPRPAQQTTRGDWWTMNVPLGVADALKQLSRQRGVTLFMTLLAAFKVLLHRYTRQEDIIVGSPIAGRNRTETEGLIGFFINTLAMRTNLGGDPTFVELLQRVQETTLGAYSHQDLPFEKLVEELQPARDQSHSPIFQMLFILQNAPKERMQLHGARAASLEVHSRTSKFDLTVAMMEQSEGLLLGLEFNTDLFDKSTICRLGGHLVALLEGIVADPQRRISELPLLGQAERRQLLVEWNATQQDYPRELRLHQLFEAQVARVSQVIAAEFGDQRLTYGELNARANRLAHHLRKLGVGPDVLVGICVERSLEMLVGLLGILKAGGAYVPLDPAFPRDRLAFMAEDSKMPVLLTQERLVATLPPHEAKVFQLDADWDDVLTASDANPENLVAGEHLAYVLYTSGSTGKPKGVQISHQAVVNFLESMRVQPGLTADDAILAVTTLSFDIAGLELFLPLAVGARVVIASRESAADGRKLLELLHGSRATVMQATPATWQMLLDAGWQRNGHLKILCGGEALNRELAAKILERCDELWNMYGPTETTIWSAVCQVEPGKPILVGTPIANTQIHILDPRLELAPIGVPGELHIGGDGLARGYLNRAELTAEKFIKDPFSGKPDARLYKTGDLARYLPDGNIEFLGRLDFQVKVRGFRIELGEIEAALARHPAVKQDVVVVREDAPGDKRIVAYLVAQPGQSPTGAELRPFLKTSLPDYMVPAAFVTLDALPLTPNGKVDRKALPAPKLERGDGGEGFAPPKDALELQLVKIWEQVLNVRPVGTADNFFELGGHSLMAVQLFAQIERATGKSLPIAALFSAPTVGQLAEFLRRDGFANAWSSLVPINAGGSKPPFFCVHAAGGNVLFYRDLANRLGPDQPFYGLQPKGLDGREERHKTIEEMAAHYIKEIRSLQPEGPYYFGGASYGGLVIWEMAVQLQRQGQQVALLALFDTHGPGYPRFLPSTTKFRRKLNFQMQVVKHHWTSFWMLEGRARWPYVWSKLKKLRVRYKRRVRKWYRNAATRILRALGKTVPKSLVQTQDTIMAAGRVYQPPLYSGRVTLFRASDQPMGIHPEPTLGWDKVAKGELEMFEIPGIHGTMVAEPRAPLLAAKLKPYFEPVTRKETPPIAETPVASAASPIEDAYPLSPMQRAMLFHSFFAPGSGVYIQQDTVEMNESIEVERFKAAWHQVIRRHPILRTSFHWEGTGDPVQEVHREVTPAWHEEDWRALAAVEQGRRFDVWLADDRVRGFATALPPLLRFALFRLGETRFQFVWTYHHALLDGRGRLLVFKEMFAWYDAARHGVTVQLEAARPYRDYITALAQRDVAAEEKFWRDQLRGFAEPTPLVVGRVAEKKSATRPLNREAEVRFSATETAALESLAKQRQVTLNTVVMGAWALVLNTYSGHADVVFGVTRHGLKSALGEVANLAGLAINTLPLRVRIAPDDSLAAVLGRVRAQWTAMRPHEHAPLEQVQAWSEVPRGTALFESIVVFDHKLAENVLPTRDEAWRNRTFRLREQTGMPLTIAAYAGGELLLKIEYDPGRFDDEVAARLAGHLRTVLENFVACPERRVAEVSVLTAAERQQLLVEWNATQTPAPVSQTFPELFEAQVERTPDAVAVVIGEQQLTYRELNERANQLAHHLRSLGVGPDVLVGMCVQRSLEMAVGLLGVMKAGGAYVPLDPAYPVERLDFMIQDSQVPVLLTQAALTDVLPQTKATVLRLDTDWACIGQESRINPPVRSTGASLAYMIYTSGSTGKPKGVLITQAALVNHNLACLRAYDLRAGDRVLQFTSLSFDISVEEIFPTWACGAVLVFRTDPVLSSFTEFVHWLAEYRVTVLNIPTAFWHEWVGGLSPAQLPLMHLLRLVVVGGEKVSVAHWRTWRKLVGTRIRWFDSYGPTETTVTTTMYEPPPELPDGADLADLPIGRPIANYQLYVMDRHLRPVPVGVPGELHVGGCGLARGYHQRPELTAEKFIPDPFSREPGARLYKTGDLVRYRNDGNVEFLGRIDHQVKVRGFRIELGEIEDALGRHPGVKQCVTIVREDAPGDKRIVAYVVADADLAPEPGALRRFLKGKLPDFMVPSAFVGLQAIPLTPNGKVDRRALPAPQALENGEVGRSHAAPRDALELQLTKIWEQVLNVRLVGTRDNFFELGGHSLMAVHLFARIEKVFGKNIPLAVLFQAPTVAELAEVLRKDGCEVSWSSLVPIQPRGRKLPLFCVHAAGGNVLFYRDLARRLGLDQPFYGLQPVGLDGRQPCHRSIEEMAAHYLREIRTVQPEGPYHLGGSSYGGVVAWEMAQQLRAQGEAVGLLALFDTYGPGYPRYLPTTTKWQQKLYQVMEVTRHHWGSLRMLEGRAKLDYFLAKARKAKNRYKRKVRRSFRPVMNKLFAATGRALPAALAGIQSAIDQAYESYTPRPYAGRVILFRALDQPMGIHPDPLLGWGPLIGGELEIIDVPGFHGSMVMEPRVRVLAEKLVPLLNPGTRPVPAERPELAPAK